MRRMRRLVPQKVRTRLALLYAGLFLISGSALLRLTYGLVASNLPPSHAAATFDELLDGLDLAFAAQRRFVANASHELRPPLTVMRTAIDVALAKPNRTTEQLEDMAARVHRSIDRAENMIEALLVLAISDQGRAGSELLDLSAAAEDALDLAAPGITPLGLTGQADLSPAETTGDQPLIERMVWNLVDNPVTHNQPGGCIRASTGSCAQGVVLRIANSGAQVPADAVPTLFEPFRRMEGRARADGGVRLGLSIAQAVSTAPGPRLAMQIQPGGGLSITLVPPHRAQRTRWSRSPTPA